MARLPQACLQLPAACCRAKRTAGAADASGLQTEQHKRQATLKSCLQMVALSGNLAGADGAASGVGGGIALSERCSVAGCDAVSARLLNLTLTGNAAGLAGGAVFFNGTNRNSRLELKCGPAAALATQKSCRPARPWCFSSAPACYSAGPAC